MVSKYLMERSLDDLRRYLNRQAGVDKYCLVLDEVEELIEKQEEDLNRYKSEMDELNRDYLAVCKENDDLDHDNCRLRHRNADMKERLKKLNSNNCAAKW